MMQSIKEIEREFNLPIVLFRGHFLVNIDQQLSYIHGSLFPFAACTLTVPDSIPQFPSQEPVPAREPYLWWSSSQSAACQTSGTSSCELARGVAGLASTYRARLRFGLGRRG